MSGSATHGVIRFTLYTQLILGAFLAAFLAHHARHAARVQRLKQQVDILGGTLCCEHDVVVVDGLETVPDDCPLDASLGGLPTGWFVSPIGIDFSGCPLNDQQLRQVLRDAWEIQGLCLVLTNVTDAAGPSLARLNKLRALDLGGTKITDQMLRHLSQLNRLEELDLSATGITDRGLQMLGGIETLRQLNLTDAAVTLSAIDELQDRLPQCEILGW